MERRLNCRDVCVLEGDLVAAGQDQDHASTDLGDRLARGVAVDLDRLAGREIVYRVLAVAGLEFEKVGARAAFDRIVAGAAGDHVRPVTAVDSVAAAGAGNRIVPSGTPDEVGAARAV